MPRVSGYRTEKSTGIVPTVKSDVPGNVAYHLLEITWYSSLEEDSVEKT